LTERNRWVARSLFVVALCSIPNRASAEKVLASADGWQVFSDGRAGAFGSYAHGNGIPQPTVVLIPDASGVAQPYEIHSVQGGRLRKRRRRPGQIDIVRIRSGFVSNTFGFGVRGPVTPYTTASAYIQLWAFVENFDRRKGQDTPPDVRQGWAKLEGPWGSVQAGRVPALFSRGATAIDALYAHRWGLGFPGAIDNNGPTRGQIGFGLLGAGFSGGAIYATPVPRRPAAERRPDGRRPTPGQRKLDAHQVSTRRSGADVRAKVPGRLGQGRGVRERRAPEVYKSGYCNPTAMSMFVPETNSYLPCDVTVLGAVGGGRLELGPFHLGASGFYGKGNGDKLRARGQRRRPGQDRQPPQDHRSVRADPGRHWEDGSVRRLGITQVYLTDYDKNYRKPDPRDPRSRDPDPAIQAMSDTVLVWSVLKYQMGINAGVVYHVVPNVHLDLDFFRAEAGWWAVNGFAGQTQVVWVGNGGMTVNW
jgi:hypothetical protein